VRRWIRAVRDPEHVEWLRIQAVVWLERVDRDVISTLTSQPTRLGEALTAPAAAAVTLRARVVPHVPPWTPISQTTHGRLVGRPMQPGRAEIPRPPGPRAPAPTRDRDDVDPARTRLALGCLTTTAPQ
jgi:hypothetical protein